MPNLILYKKIVKSITYLVLLFILFFCAKVQAQQDAQYTQYMYNTISVNPAYAGSRGHASVGLLHRSQWLGLEGAPTTRTFNVHSPIGYRGVGLGFSIVQDEIGPTSETNFDVDFSYTIYTSKEGRLSFGLKGSANLLNVDFTKLNQFQYADGPDDNRFSPNIGAGVYYHTQEFYIGLSVPRFLQTTHFDESSLSKAKEQMNFYFITGYVFEMTHFWKFKPTLLVKAVQGAPIQADISTNFMYDDKLVLGAAYRWDAAVSALVGFNVTDQLLIGLAYDREVSELGNAAFNNGSFEILFRYDFIKKNKKNLRSPRFF